MQKGSAATFPTLTVSLGWILETITLGLGYSSAIVLRLHNSSFHVQWNIPAQPAQRRVHAVE